MRPLNGTKTHPLSKHALDVLAILARTESGIPAYRVNPGVRNRFYREDLARVEGANRRLIITDAGRAALQASANRQSGQDREPIG